MRTVCTFDEGIEIREVPNETFDKLTAGFAQQIFDTTQYFYSPRKHYSPEETAKTATLKENMGQPLRLNFCAFQNDQIIGWTWGLQESSEVFYMVNSAVLPNHRNKGIYSKLSSILVKEVSARGFQIISSRHVATNNAVIIPKLRAGFVITSLELSDQYGVLVHLKWYANAARRKMLDFRAGGCGFDQEVKKILKI